MERSSLSSIDSEVDELIACGTKSEEECSDQLVSEIHPDLFFRRNSVNLVCGRRGSGKTYLLMRELLKCLMLGHNEYTQLFYISSKYSDDTVQKFQPLLEKYIQFSWIETKDALQLITALEFGKANLNEPKFRECLNAQSLPEGVIPNTFLVFDDAINVFSKPSELMKKLFQNRQSRITAFVVIQDVQGMSSSFKSNIDSMVLFGSFSAQKFQVLTYQLPPVEGFNFSTYSQLTNKDCVLIDFQTSSIQYRLREKEVLSRSSLDDWT